MVNIMVNSYEYFTWQGKPILDINQWCQDRGESLIHYHAERMVPSPFPTKSLLIKEERDGIMPESFWNSLRQDGGWVYTELQKEPTHNR